MSPEMPTHRGLVAFRGYNVWYSTSATVKHEASCGLSACAVAQDSHTTRSP